MCYVHISPAHPQPSGPSGKRPSRHNNKGVHIVFDEENLKSSRRESLLARGIPSRIDDAVEECALYVGHEITQPNQAADKLQGATPGSFVTYGELCVAIDMSSFHLFQPFFLSDTINDVDELLISIMGADGAVKHGRLAHTMDGMFLVLPPHTLEECATRGPHFERLSHVLLYYASDAPADHKNLLTLTNEQRELLQEHEKEAEVHHKQGTTGKGHQGPYRELKADDSWYRRKCLIERAERWQ